MISPVPRNLPEINLYGSSATPPTSLSRDEYPFSADGTYVEAWAVAGEARAGRSSYVSSSEPRRATVTPKRSSATSRKPVKSSSRASSSRSTSTKKKAPARSSSSKTKKKR